MALTGAARRKEAERGGARRMYLCTIKAKGRLTCQIHAKRSITWRAIHVPRATAVINAASPWGVALQETRRAGRTWAAREPLTAACAWGDHVFRPRVSRGSPQELSHKCRQLCPQRAVKLCHVLDRNIEAASRAVTVTASGAHCGLSRYGQLFGQLAVRPIRQGPTTDTLEFQSTTFDPARGNRPSHPFLVRFAAKVARRRDFAPGDGLERLENSLYPEHPATLWDQASLNSATKSIDAMLTDIRHRP